MGSNRSSVLRAHQGVFQGAQEKFGSERTRRSRTLEQREEPERHKQKRHGAEEHAVVWSAPGQSAPRRASGWTRWPGTTRGTRRAAAPAGRSPRAGIPSYILHTHSFMHSFIHRRHSFLPSFPQPYPILFYSYSILHASGDLAQGAVVVHETGKSRQDPHPDSMSATLLEEPWWNRRQERERQGRAGGWQRA